MQISQIVEEGKPLKQAKKAIILLHGRGGTAKDIIPLADEFCDDSFYIVAPQASGNTWYPYTFLAPEDQNEPWLTSAIKTVKSLINRITQHIPAEKIYIMGFSQGACLSLEVAARYAQKYAGVAAFSGGLIGEIIRSEKYGGDFTGTKVFIGNSDNDPHIPLERTEKSADLLKQLGADVIMAIYPGMGHTISQAEIDTVKQIMF